MQTSLRRRANGNAAGFSLIELLVVVALIVVLAGLTIASMAYVHDRVARNRAKLQIKLLETALEEYKRDNRQYPQTTDDTGQTGSAALYKALYGDGDTANGGSATAKMYLDQLEPVGNREGKGGQQWIRIVSGGQNQIVDPWGHPYLYRVGTAALNPDFDLWSMGKDGKTNASDPKGKDSLDDVWGSK